MKGYKQTMTKEGVVYRLIGFEGNIPIWQNTSKTRSSEREYYANIGLPVTAHTVSEIRDKIRNGITDD